MKTLIISLALSIISIRSFAVEEQYLFHAVESGDLKKVALALENSAVDINGKDNKEYTVLMHASLLGFIDITKHLLTIKDIDISYVNNKGDSALKLASIAGHIHIMSELIDKMRERDETKDTVAIVAARFGHVETMKKIIADEKLNKTLEEGWHKKFNLGQDDSITQTIFQYPITLAIYNMQVEMVALLAPIIDLNKERGTCHPPLSCALSWYAQSYFNTVSSHLFLPSSKSLRERANNGLVIINLLIDNGADVFYMSKNYGSILYVFYDAWFESWIYYDKYHGARDLQYFFSLFKTIFDKIKTNPEKLKEIINLRKGMFIKAASHTGPEEIVKLLLDHGSVVGDDKESKGERKGRSYIKYSALYYAAGAGHFDIVKLLVEKGAKINYRAHKCEAAIYGALEHGHMKIVDYLLKQGAILENVSIDFIGSVASKNQLEALKWLHQQGCALSDNVKDSPMRWAAQAGHVECLRYLLENSAHKKPDTLSLAIYYAAHYGHIESVKLLMQHGAVFDVAGHGSPLPCAARRGYFDTIAFLLNSDNQSVLKNQDDLDRTLCFAACYGQFKIAEFLLSKRAHVDAQLTDKWGNEKLTNNVEGDKLSFTCQGSFYGKNILASEIFLAESRVTKPSALAWALHNDHADVALLLIDKGAQFLDSNHQKLREYLSSYTNKLSLSKKAKLTIEMSLAFREVFKRLNIVPEEVLAIFDNFLQAKWPDPHPESSAQEIDAQYNFAQSSLATRFQDLLTAEQ